MNEHGRDGLSARDLAAILEVTRGLAAPFDLTTMLREVTGAARQVLDAERSSVWLFDADACELVLKVSSDIRDVRVALGVGLVGACARDRQVINVPDCYADPRFDPAVDKRSGFHTRCALTLPLVDHRDALVGVMQVLNRSGGVFDAADEALATALAAQCAVALQRVQMTEALIEGERMRAELEMARAVQMSTLPATMPLVPGYDVFGIAQPAEQTGGDTFLVATPNIAAIEPVVIGDLAQNLWYQSADIYSNYAALRLSDLGGSRTNGLGVWGQIYYSEDRTGRQNLSVFGNDFNVNCYRTKRRGAQAGVDYLLGGNAVIGITGGYERAEADFEIRPQTSVPRAITSVVTRCSAPGTDFTATR